MLSPPGPAQLLQSILPVVLTKGLPSTAYFEFRDLKAAIYTRMTPGWQEDLVCSRLSPSRHASVAERCVKLFRDRGTLPQVKLREHGAPTTKLIRERSGEAFLPAYLCACGALWAVAAGSAATLMLEGSWVTIHSLSVISNGGSQKYRYYSCGPNKQGPPNAHTGHAAAGKSV